MHLTHLSGLPALYPKYSKPRGGRRCESQRERERERERESLQI